jgi:hypothetical protein
MSNSDPYFLLAALVGVAAAVYWSATGATRTLAEKFVDSVSMGSGKPILWFVVDDNGTNSRHWVDFAARRSNELNIGFLTVTRSRCARTQGNDFQITELLGRQAVTDHVISLGGRVPYRVQEAPPAVWRAWARAALLTYSGGLYFDGLSLCLGSSFAPIVAGHDDALFGTEHDETRVTTGATAGPFTGWASGAGHAGWARLTTVLADLIGAGPTAWTAAIARNQIAEWTNLNFSSNLILRNAEWSRHADGRAVELEDILGRAPAADLIPTEAIYIPLDHERLERDYTYGWFLRMSPEQILDPDSYFVWAAAARR